MRIIEVRSTHNASAFSIKSSWENPDKIQVMKIVDYCVESGFRFAVDMPGNKLIVTITVTGQANLIKVMNKLYRIANCSGCHFNTYEDGKSGKLEVCERCNSGSLNTKNNDII